MNEKHKVLVIDDEKVILDSAQRILAAEGFPVQVSADAENALECLDEDAADIVISDLMLPGMSGIEFMEAVHRQDPNLVVIITTGYSTIENGIAALRKGAFDFLPKPFRFEELLSPVYRASRFLERPLATRLELLQSEPGGGYVLGLQSWARLEEGGTAVLGVTRLFLETTLPLEGIEFPEIGAPLRQGGRMVSCSTADKLTHCVWSPLSGQVLAIDESATRDLAAADEDSQVARWLVRVLPSDPDSELANLRAC